MLIRRTFSEKRKKWYQVKGTEFEENEQRGQSVVSERAEAGTRCAPLTLGDCRPLDVVYGLSSWLGQSLGRGESLTRLSQKPISEGCESTYLMLSFERTDQLGRQKKV